MTLSNMVMASFSQSQTYKGPIVNSEQFSAFSVGRNECEITIPGSFGKFPDQGFCFSAQSHLDVVINSFSPQLGHESTIIRVWSGLF